MSQPASPRILLVDDDAVLTNMLAGFLSGEGFLVDVVDDGAAGTEAALSGRYYAVVLDVAMQQLAGAEVLRSVRSESAVPIIVLTAKGADVDRAVGLELGADDYILKPYFPRELVARLRAVLRRSSAVTCPPDAPWSTNCLQPLRALLDRLGITPSRRLGGVIAALVLEGLFLLLILGLNPNLVLKREPKRISVFTLTPETAPPESAPKSTPRSKQREARTPELPPATRTPLPVTATQAKPTVAPPSQTPPAPPTEAPAPATPPSPSYGPPAPAASAASGDTPIVGTAPNGKPLYAAAWYREPYDDELRGYLSTADGPGWALIACRTVEDYRVEDCVGLAEHPEGSNMLRSVLAAAWQFKIRPPRRGDKLLWGSWVRIRIDYLDRTQRPELWRRDKPEPEGS